MNIMHPRIRAPRRDDKYAELQIFKLKVCIVLAIAVWASHGFPPF